VDLWVAFPSVIRDEALLRRYEELLEPKEHARMRAFHFDRHRCEYLVTRALVRTTLSRYRDVPPAAWRFRANRYGRPTLEEPEGLFFNLTNHPTMVVCAVASHLDVGVDVEPLTRAKDILGVSSSVFSRTELAELNALSTDQRSDRAVALWTLKESYIKGRGMGLALPLEAFSFGFRAADPTIEFHEGISDDARRWSFRIRDHAGHRIAVAFGGPRAEDVVVRLREVVPLTDETTEVA